MADGLATERARLDRRHDIPPRPRALPPGGSPAAQVPPGAAVLWLGPIAAAESAELEARGCRASVLPISGAPGDENRPAPADVADLDFGRARFDAVVAPDVLGRVPRPERMLDALRRALKAGGCLIASVPNAAHPEVVAALARGESPYTDAGPIDAGQARLFTRESLAAAIEAADFAVSRARGLTDPRGEVAAWMVVALALPVPGLERLQEQFRRESFARDEAERAAETLRELLAQGRRAIDSGHARAEAASGRELAARAALAEAHEAMRLRDEEYGATVRNLLDRLEEVEPLRRERDAAHRHALAAEARCRSLELRAEHILMEFPRRVARGLRRRLSRRGS